MDQLMAGGTSGLGDDGNPGLRGEHDSVTQEFDLQVKELAYVICFRRVGRGGAPPLNSPLPASPEALEHCFSVLSRQ